MDDGWDRSAQAWIDGIGEHGDWSRHAVLDRPMLARVSGRGFNVALDLGCGEGRFCRLMQAQGIRTVGVDPTAALIGRARLLHPDGDYRIERAEALNLGDATVDLAVSYLSLIDIPDLEAAIREVRRVLRPGGTFLIANLQSFNTASEPEGWRHDADGWHLRLRGYLGERSRWAEWGDIQVRNWHRPLSTYMAALLNEDFEMRHFSEPEPEGDMSERALQYRQAPWFLVMEWQKSAGGQRRAISN